jgi:hypothetical protein
MQMQKFRIGLAFAAAIGIVFHVVFLDYQNLGFRSNGGSYLGIISLSLVMASMVISYRHQNKSNQKGVRP